MREIKFRVWNTETNKMIINVKEMGVFALQSIYSIDEFLVIPTNEKYPLMQYTGLKDKNGVEIYEGDIINNGYENLEIKWDDDRCCFNMRGRYSRSHIIRQLDCDIVLDLNIEVIGNIYENKELLES